jgi:hypothetical protein
MFQEFKKVRTWLWLVVAAMFDLVKRLVEHRMLVWINDHIDEQAGRHWSELRGGDRDISQSCYFSSSSRTLDLSLRVPRIPERKAPAC